MSNHIRSTHLRSQSLIASSRWVALVEKHTQKAGDRSAVDASHTTEPQSLREGLPPLDLATIKDFIRFIASVSDGIIDEENNLVTTDSLNTFAEWFFAGFARVTGNRIEEEDRRSVYNVSIFSKSANSS